MKLIKRTIRIVNPNKATKLYDDTMPPEYDPANYKTLKIVSIQVKGIDLTDINFEVDYKDWATSPKTISKTFYLGDYGEKFKEQFSFLVFYPQTDEAFTLKIPPSADKIEMRVSLLNKDTDFTSMEVVVNVIYSLE